MNRRRRWLLSVATGVALVTAACGDDGESSSTPAPMFTRTPVAATSSSTVSPSATVAATPHVVATASADEPVASTAYIPASELPLAVMTAGDGSEYELPIEVPARDEYSIGLSGRLELGERAMLFWYAEPTTQSFWMKDTHYDLSIAFVDGEGTIVDLLLLEAESLQIRVPGDSYRYAIEAPAGWFEERGIGVGDRAVLDFEIPEFLQR